MAEIYKDQTAPIKTKIFWGGELRDADDDVTAVVYDITEDNTVSPTVDPNTPIGDFVATRGEPAYADYYNCKDGEFVVVPELDPKYILEPVACGINCVVDDFQDRANTKTLILGSGFLA